jgi:hypothetical protein
MKSIYSLCLSVLTAGLLLLSACKKDDHPHGGGNQWQITKLVTHEGSLTWADSAIFTYNHKGNPVKISRGLPATGAPDYLFRYDAPGRLQDYVGVYLGGINFEFWTRYYYDAQGRVAGDTTYNFGVVGPNGPLPDPNAPPPYDQLYIGSTQAYQYDNQNRITAVLRTYNGGYSQIYQYDYNAAGNLEWFRALDGQDHSLIYEVHYTVYDNKVNMHRTHPVWQLIDRNYSVNNPFIAETYNAKGLPLKIHEPVKLGAGNFIGVLYEHLDVTYKQCW